MNYANLSYCWVLILKDPQKWRKFIIISYDITENPFLTLLPNVLQKFLSCDNRTRRVAAGAAHYIGAHAYQCMTIRTLKVM